jgi:hypothetical protein
LRYRIDIAPTFQEHAMPGFRVPNPLLQGDMQLNPTRGYAALATMHPPVAYSKHQRRRHRNLCPRARSRLTSTASFKMPG